VYHRELFKNNDIEINSPDLHNYQLDEKCSMLPLSTPVLGGLYVPQEISINDLKKIVYETK
jgi:hypothetical protein